MDNKIRHIGAIAFKDIEIQVYYDPYTGTDTINAVWKQRGGDLSYQGPVYMNMVTRKVSYPKGAAVNKLTDRDRELLPNAIVVGRESIDKEFTDMVLDRLEERYLVMNKKE